MNWLIPREWRNAVIDVWRNGIDDDTRLELMLKLTLIYHLGLLTNHASRASFPAFFLAILGLVFSRVLRHPIFWAAVVGVFGIHLAVKEVSFSSRFLNFYWCVAIFIALLCGRYRQSILALNGRLLIGLVFLLAILWKTIFETDFINGITMRYSLLFCYIFNHRVVWMGLIDSNTHEANLEIWNSLAEADGPVAPIPVNETSLLTVIAWTATIWTIVIEALLALSFLSPNRWRIAKLRPIAMLVFIWTVYLFLPVWIFGALFCVLTIAVLPPREGRWLILLVVTFFVQAILQWYIDIPVLSGVLRGELPWGMLLSR